MNRRIRLLGKTLYVTRSKRMQDFGWFDIEGPKQARVTIPEDLDIEEARKAALHEISHAVDWLLEEHKAHASEAVGHAVLQAAGLWGEE